MKINHYYLKALDNMLRASAKPEDFSLLQEGSSEANSFIFPIEDEILKKDNLFRKHATVLNCFKNGGTIVATVSNTKATIIPENGNYPEQNDEFSEARFSSYKIGSLTKIKTWFIYDRNFDVKAYLSGEFARRFGKAEEDICLNGTGINEPLGLLKTAQTGATSTELTYDKVVDLYFSVQKEYRTNAIFIMSDETAMTLRKLKDADGNPLWNHSNNTIFGKEVVISPYMEDAEKPIIFGDLTYFWMIIRKPLAVSVLNERYAETNDIGYIANERLDSKLVRSNAIKVLVINKEEINAQ